MAGIVVDAPLLRVKAGELRGYRAEHDETINKIKNLVNGLPEQFKGEAASAYMQKFNDMQSTFTNFSELLEDLAKKLDESARIMEEADQAAAKVNSQG